MTGDSPGDDTEDKFFADREEPHWDWGDDERRNLVLSIVWWVGIVVGLVITGLVVWGLTH